MRSTSMVFETSLVISGIGGRRVFYKGGAVLRLGLKLRYVTVEMKARPVRYDSAGRQGYVVGALILGMSEADRITSLRFLREPANSGQCARAKTDLRYARASSGQDVDRLAPLS